MAQSNPTSSGNVSPAVWLGLVGVAVLGLAAFKFFTLRPSPDTERSSDLVEVARTNLVLEGGRLCFAGTTNLFTGLMVEHHAGGTLRSRTAVTNGLLHGLSHGWYTNTQLQVEETFREGTSHGTRTKWYASGVKESEAPIANGVLHGTFRRWHENGAPSEQAELVEGRPEGLSLAWFPSRSLKGRVLMKEGKVMEQTFWKDGEKLTDGPGE